jgi:hypothetical protein
MNESKSDGKGQTSKRKSSLKAIKREIDITQLSESNIVHLSNRNQARKAKAFSVKAKSTSKEHSRIQQPCKREKNLHP